MADEELIDGTYTLVMCIATGGSSQVWEVVQKSTGRNLAMKLLKAGSSEFKQNKVSLKNEASILKTLNHPLIVKFESFSSNRDNTYMTMEHFRAANLKLQLKMDMTAVHVRARQLFEGICQAISYVHSHGWIHRDIKPDNVLMNKAGEIRLVDFSLTSKSVNSFVQMIGAGRPSSIRGPRTYIAPETIRKETPRFQTDLYSLGILFFEVLTGKTPFQATTPDELLQKHLRSVPSNASEFNTNVSAEMDRLIGKLLKKKITDRPASIDEVLSELRRIKIFKEDVTEELIAKRKTESSDTMSELTEARLDSRADAKLRVILESNPEMAQQFEEDKRAKAAKKTTLEDQRKASILKSSPKPKQSDPVPMPQPVPAPPQPFYPPQGQYPFPMMPMMGPPPAMMPGFAGRPVYPGMQYPPQFPPPYAMPPIMPMPQGYPGAAAPIAAGPHPFQQTPSLPLPPRLSVPTSPLVAPNTQPPASPGVNPPAAVTPPVSPQELEFMTELPDVH